MAMNIVKSKVRQKKRVYVTIFLVVTLLFNNVVEADFATPFMEISNKVGDISEAHGYVVSLNPDIEKSTRFLVIIGTDRKQHVVIKATA